MNVLVCGFMGKANLGDELFKLAFQKLFPTHTFTFIDQLKLDAVKGADAVFIGGGSFLFADPVISAECDKLLKTKPILYIGVGAETDIHPKHQELMRSAKLVAIRSNVGYDKIVSLNPNTIVIPDLVYSLEFSSDAKRVDKSVLIIPNISVVPDNKSEHWMHNAWEHFKFEFSQFVDHFLNEQFTVHFAGMSKSSKSNDDWAAIEIINSMHHRNSNLIIDDNVNDIICKYETVITQRFHGIILSEITRTPYISIYHHDKLRNSHLNEGIFMSYYGAAKQDYIDNFNRIRAQKLDTILPIGKHSFERLVEEVNALLK